LKALRIIPFLVVLLVLVYFGVLFVEANQEMVVVTLGSYVTKPTRLGFVVMTSALLGLVLGGTLAVIQIIFLTLENRSLRKRLAAPSKMMDKP
jgi:hypothetical protein